MERFEGEGCGHFLSQAVLVDYGVWEIQILLLICWAVGDRIGEWIGLAGSSDIGLLGWCILTVDGDQSLVNGDQSVVKF